MKKNHLIILIIIVFIVLGAWFWQQNKEEALLPQVVKTEFSDEEIWNAIDSDYKIPEGFFDDGLEENENISDMASFQQQLAGSGWSFPCTDKKTVAKQLTYQRIDQYNSGVGPIKMKKVEESENEKFFETKAELTPSPNGQLNYMRYRILKCDYVDNLQTSADTYKTATTIGTFNKKVTRNSVKEMVEFLWYSVFNSKNLSGSTVLSSFNEDLGDSIKHTLYETTGNTSFPTGWGVSKGKATLIKSEYTINKKTGEIKLYQEIIKTITEDEMRK